MFQVPCTLEGEDLADSEEPRDFSDSDIVCYKYARVVSRDGERTLSQYKSLLTDSRTDVRCTN
jgi:hypothetical protein